MEARELLQKISESKGYADFIQMVWESSFDEIETTVLEAMEKHKSGTELTLNP